MNRLALILGLSVLYGFGPPKHSKVDVVAATEKGKKVLQFKIVPNSDMSVTFDAPWELKLKNVKGFAIKSTSFKKSDMKESLPGFQVETTGAAAGSVDYRLTSFICTKDKTQCFREVHKGTFSQPKT